MNNNTHANNTSKNLENSNLVVDSSLNNQTSEELTKDGGRTEEMSHQKDENYSNKPKLSKLQIMVALLFSVIIAITICYPIANSFVENNPNYVTITYDIKFNGIDNKNIVLETFYTLNAKQQFNEKQKVKTTIKLSANNQWQTAKFAIPLKNNEKLHKFRIDVGDYPEANNRPQQVSIRNISVNGIKVGTLQEKKDIFVKHAQVNLSSNKISLDINNRDPYIFFLKAWDIKSNSILAFKFLDINKAQILTLTIILLPIVLLGYLSLSKLLLLQNGTRTPYANVTLIALVAFTILLPTSNIDTKSVKSDIENRNLAVYKPLTTNGIINSDYGKSFENWFNDRFYLRTELQKIRTSTYYKLNRVFMKNKNYRLNDWIWADGDFVRFDRNKLEKLVADAISLKNHWNAKNLILLVYPSKSEIYCEYTLQTRCVKSSHILFEQIQQRLKSLNITDPNIKLFNISPYLEKHKKGNDLLFFLDEHHMTQYGNQIVIDGLIEAGLLPQSNNDYHKYEIHSKCATGEFFIPNNCIPDQLNNQYLKGTSYGIILGNRWQEDRSMPTHQYIYYNESPQYQKDVTIQNIKIENIQSNMKSWQLATYIKNSAPNIYTTKISVLGNSFIETLSRALSTRYSDVYRLRTSSGYGLWYKARSLDNKMKNQNLDMIIIPIYIPTAIN